MCGAVTNLIRKALNRKDQRFGPQYLPFVLNALNTTVHTATGYTPRSLFLGRLSDREMVPLVPLESEAATCTEYLQHIRKAQELAFQIARARSKKLVAKRKADVNKKAREHPYKVGDFVLIQNKSPAKGKGNRKLRAKYIGPFRIVHVYPRSLIVIPWGEEKDFKNKLKKSNFYGLINRGNVRPYSPRLVNVKYCKPFKGLPEQAIIDPELINEFLQQLDANQPHSLYSEIQPRTYRDYDDFIELSSAANSNRTRRGSEGPDMGRDFIDSSDDDSDDDRRPFGVAAEPPPEDGPEINDDHNTNPPSSMSSRELLENLSLDWDDLRLLDNFVLDEEEYEQADEDARQAHHQVKDILDNLRSPDLDLRGQAEQELENLLRYLKGDHEEEIKEDNDDPITPIRSRDPSPEGNLDDHLAENEPKPESQNSSIRRPGELHISTDNFDIHISPEKPGVPRVVRRNTDGDTLSGVPPTQPVPGMLRDWLENVAADNEAGPSNRDAYVTRRGRRSVPPSRFDPSKAAASDKEERMFRRGLRASLGEKEKGSAKDKGVTSTPRSSDESPESGERSAESLASDATFHSLDAGLAKGGTSTPKENSDELEDLK